MTSSLELRGRQALVTGATGGIGSAIARALAEAGASVAVHFHTDAEGAVALATELSQAYPDADFPIFRADVADPHQVAEMFTAVGERWGGLDILVNNAGINRDRTLRKIAVEDWKRVLDVNLVGVVHSSRLALPLLRPDRGRIVSIASVLAVTGNYGMSNYAAAKAGIIGFSKSLAQEVARDRITVNVVAPGFIDTPMTAPMTPEYRQRWIDRIPLGRFGRPDEVAACVRFLASDAASYVTGSVLHVNGGLW